MINELFGRIQEEKKELDEKLSKLYAFIESRKFENLSSIHKMLLRKQLDTMTDYSAILSVRIELLNK